MANTISKIFLRVIDCYKRMYEIDPKVAKDIFDYLKIKTKYNDEDELDELFMIFEDTYETLLSMICPSHVAYTERIDNMLTSEPGVEVWILADESIKKSNQIYELLDKNKEEYPESLVQGFMSLYIEAYTYLNSKFLYCSEYMEIRDVEFRDGEATKIKIQLDGGIDITRMPYPLYYLMAFIYNLRNAVAVFENYESNKGKELVMAS